MRFFKMEKCGLTLRNIYYPISKFSKTKCCDLKNSSSQKIFKMSRKKFHHL